MRIVDLHCDTIMGFYEGKHLKEMDGWHISLDKLKAGGCLAQCFAIYVPSNSSAAWHGITDTPEEYFDKAYAAYLREMELCKDDIRPAFCVGDVLDNEKAGFMSSILTVEDSVTLRGRIEELDEYYKKGVRMATLTWNFENSLGYPQNADPELHKLGLKPFGIEAVKRMNELGIAVDVSHLSEGGFWDVVKYSSKPIVASHSCCRGIRDISRNLTDEQIKAIAESGGVIGINFANDFLRDVVDRKTDKLSYMSDVVKHLRRMADLGGVECLALGSDYDGIGSVLEWKDYAGYPRLIEEIAKEFGEDVTELICNGNALRAFKDTIG